MGCGIFISAGGNMRIRLSVFLITIMAGVFLGADYEVTRVDFLSEYRLEVNGAGPLLVKSDPIRNKIIVAHTYTSSVSLIDGRDHSVLNIPIRSRIPQYLKDEALQIDSATGHIYLIGNRCLHVVIPEKKKAITIPTNDQFEMVAINEASGDACLVGRSSRNLVLVSLKTGKIRTLAWLSHRETMVNLNQTPPPPIRKVVWDRKSNSWVAIDGFSARLFVFSSSGRILKERKLKVKPGVRWHFAAYNQNNHCLYLVIETDKRKVVEAVKIDIRRGRDLAVTLPEFSEAVGINYNSHLDEVYIPYDNHPSVHVVSFRQGGKVSEIKIPAYGNDASAIDLDNQKLFVSSWAYGEINVLDLGQRKLTKRIRNLGIIPHMFSMSFNPANQNLYIPIGATAVNGSFGAAVTCLDTRTFKTRKVYTGWAPVDSVALKNRDGVLVFNSEDSFAEVQPDGSSRFLRLPCDYPGRVVTLPDGYICLAYGPHQAYWPVVYIWGAKNGILGIHPETFEFYDRRIPRLAQQIAVDRSGVLYALQNNWGREKQFVISLPDAIRSPNQGDMRWELDDMVVRETTQRILKYDSDHHWLYMVRVGERDDEAGVLQVLDLNSRKVLFRCPVGLTPVGLAFNRKRIAVGNFDSNSITVVNKADFSITRLETGEKPLDLIYRGDELVVINHQERTLQFPGGDSVKYPLPGPGRPDGLFDSGKELILTSHSSDRLQIHSFSVQSRTFHLIHEERYPYGETSFDTNNTAFFVRGQFGDGLFRINRILQDSQGCLWISDFLSGKLFIIKPESVVCPGQGSGKGESGY